MKVKYIIPMIMFRIDFWKTLVYYCVVMWKGLLLVLKRGHSNQGEDLPSGH